MVAGMEGVGAVVVGGEEYSVGEREAQKARRRVLRRRLERKWLHLQDWGGQTWVEWRGRYLGHCRWRVRRLWRVVAMAEVASSAQRAAPCLRGRRTARAC